MSDDSILNKDPKELKAMWQSENRKKKVLDRVKLANKARGTHAPETIEELEAKSDWEKLAVTADLKFPAHLSDKFNLNPQHRLIAIASCLGWSQQKIADASGVVQQTVSRILTKNEVVLEFIKAFNYNAGSQSTKEIIDKEQYSSIEVLRQLRDDPSTSASTRKEIAIWFFEQKHGKPKESKEIKGINLRELTDTLKKSKPNLETDDEIANEVIEN